MINRFVFMMLTMAAQNAITSECKNIFSDGFIEVCASEGNNPFLAPLVVSDIYAKVKGNEANFERISQEVELQNAAKLKKLKPNHYYFKAFIGGNSLAAEHRHVLLTVVDGTIINSGEFSGYEDLHGDGTKAFYRWGYSKLDNSRVRHQNVKHPLILRKHKLVLMDKP